MPDNIFKQFVDLIGDAAEEFINVEKNHARIWYFEKPNRETWPEEKFKSLMHKKNYGIALSGGGIRSAAASMGQIRAFHRLNLIDKVRYVGCISGGSWFALPWMYLPKKVTDNQFLGDYNSPEVISQKNMEKFFSSEDGSLFARSLSSVEFVNLQNIAKLLLKPHDPNNSTNKDETFGVLLGKEYLAPLGLFNHGKQKYATYTSQYRDTVLNRNDELNKEDFHCIEHDRPFFIANGAAINWSFLTQLETFFKKDTAVHPNDYPIYPFEFTPIYSGINTTAVKDELLTKFKYGGGYIENLGFDTKDPAGKLKDKFVKIKTDERYNRLSIQDIMATSGSAPAFHALMGKTISNAVDVGTVAADICSAGASTTATIPVRNLTDVVRRLAGIFPRYYYWHIDKTKNVTTENLYFGDGGFVDNYGVMPLLKRKVKNIIVFINSDTPFRLPEEIRNADASVRNSFAIEENDLRTLLDKDDKYNKENKINKMKIDAPLLCLFGLHRAMTASKNPPTKWSGPKMRVFQKKDFITIAKQLIKNLNSGGPVYAEAAIEVIENEFHGVAPYTANICFVSLQSCKKWKEALPPEWQKKLNEDTDLVSFPNYGTFSLTEKQKTKMTKLEELQASLDMQELNRKQIYLMTNLTDWTTEQVLKNTNYGRNLKV